ncbi:flagellar hook-associated protein FlgL [Pseudolysinimonas sp.]|uniref:flagellar hook-associated protein FlgL n=1 Tax=Pseudolysinimonas sp. TaxID=2680009 RepID=UPI003F7E8EAC
MITRITSTQLLADSARTMQAAMTRLSKLQTQASTGDRIQVPSDDPAGTGASIQVRGQQAALAQYQRNATDGSGWLSTIDGTLTQSTSILQRVRVLVLEASNSGTMSPSARDAVASEVQGLRDDLLAQANTRYNGRSVFAGTSDADAFSAAGVWSGTAGVTVDRRVGADATIPVDADGSAAFGSGPTSIFATLDSIVSDLKGGVDVQPRIAQVDAAMQKVLTVQAVNGSRYNQMERATDALGAQAIDLTKQRSDIEQVDTVQAIVDLQSQNLAYQSALQVTAKALPMSLLSFLN